MFRDTILMGPNFHLFLLFPKIGFYHNHKLGTCCHTNWALVVLFWVLFWVLFLLSKKDSSAHVFEFLTDPWLGPTQASQVLHNCEFGWNFELKKGVFVFFHHLCVIPRCFNLQAMDWTLLIEIKWNKSYYSTSTIRFGTMIGNCIFLEKLQAGHWMKRQSHYPQVESWVIYCNW